MYLSPEEIKQLEQSQVYQYYSNVPWATPTIATIQAHLDAITRTSVESLPLIKFLTMLLQSKSTEANTAKLIEMDLEITSVNTMSKVRYYHDHILAKHVTGGALSGAVSDFSAHRSVATLTGGSLADHALYQPGVGYKFAVWKVFVGVRTAAMAAVNFTLEFQDEDGGTLFSCNILGNVPMEIPLYYLHDTADKDLIVDIAGGAGSEILTFLTVAGKFA